MPGSMLIYQMVKIVITGDNLQLLQFVFTIITNINVVIVDFPIKNGDFP